MQKSLTKTTRAKTGKLKTTEEQQWLIEFEKRTIFEEAPDAFISIRTNLNPEDKPIKKIKARLIRKGWRIVNQIDLHNTIQIYPKKK